VITQAMILAAGEGRRMLPLTLDTPKPLLEVGGKTLIEWQLQRLKHCGIERVVINVAYLGEQIMDYLGDGAAYGVDIGYSQEPYPLETGGALNAALSLLDNAPFILVNGDVWCDYPLSELDDGVVFNEEAGAHSVGAHLVLVDNPEHNGRGDFILQQGRITASTDKTGEVSSVTKSSAGFTFSGLSIIHPNAISAYPHLREKFPLKEVFEWLITRNRLSGEHYSGQWIDVGTPERLRSLDRLLCYSQ